MRNVQFHVSRFSLFYNYMSSNWNEEYNLQNTPYYSPTLKARQRRPRDNQMFTLPHPFHLLTTRISNATQFHINPCTTSPDLIVTRHYLVIKQ